MGTQTNMYAFTANTYKKPIIITCNLDENFRKLSENEWIKANSHCIIAKEPMYEGDVLEDTDVERQQQWLRAMQEAPEPPKTKRLTITETQILPSPPTATAIVPVPGAVPAATVTAAVRSDAI